MSESMQTQMLWQARQYAKPAPGAYSDFNSLSNTRNSPRALEAAAQHFESVFLDMWISSMRDAGSAFSEGNYLSSSTTEMHQEMLDHQWAVHLSESGGIGLADVIVRQLGGESAGQPQERQPLRRIADPAVPAPVQVQEPSDAPELRTEAHGFRGPMFENAVDFVAGLRDLITDRVRQLGVPPVAVIAQAALETGWGSSVIHGADGQSSHNLFGVKADMGAETAVSIVSREHGISGMEHIRSSFKRYESMADGVDDYVGFLQKNPRYAALLESFRTRADESHPDAQAQDAMDDVRRFAEGLQSAGYATDPEYAQKIISVARSVARLF